MCTFKYCRETGKCFLESSSPCPEHSDAVGPKKTIRKNKDRMRPSKLRYDGFLDREFVDALQEDTASGRWFARK